MDLTGIGGGSPARPMGVAAVVERAPADIDDTIGLSWETNAEMGHERDVRWSCRDGMLPAEGDDAILFLDSQGDPWALVWGTAAIP
jgi:hypothetical protein